MTRFSKEREFQIHSTTLAAKEWGREQGIPVLASHGWLDNCGSFDVLAPLLQDVHLIALDAAGHGRSSHRRDHGPYNIWQDVTDLYHVAEQLGWQSFALLGHSRGAMISSLFAGTFPDRVSHLALIDCMWPIPVEPESAPQQLAESIVATAIMREENEHTREQAQKEKRVIAAGKGKGSIKKRGRTIFPNVADAVQARQLGRVPITEEAAHYLMERGLKRVDGGYVWSTDSKLMLPSAVKFSPQQLFAFMERITAKIHLILAPDSLPVIYDRHKTFVKDYPEVEVTELNGGHHLHMTSAAQHIATIFNEFFQQ